LFALVFGYYQNNKLEVSTYHLTNERSGPVRIAHLSDLHGKQFGTNNRRLLETVLDQEPDLVVVTGDSIHFTGMNLEKVVGFLSELNETVPVVVISGNQEWRSREGDEFIGSLRAHGVIYLENEIYTLVADGSTVHILGLDERMGGSTHAPGDPSDQHDPYETQDPAALLAELAQMPGLRIVLSHYPQYYALEGNPPYNQFDFDLMFSGHAHGGQWNLPGIGGVYAHGQGVMPQYYRGLYDGRLLVSAGLGNSGFPLRLFNHPQLVIAQIN